MAGSVLLGAGHNCSWQLHRFNLSINRCDVLNFAAFALVCPVSTLMQSSTKQNTVTVTVAAEVAVKQHLTTSGLAVQRLHVV
jgi:hypothetical protein